MKGELSDVLDVAGLLTALQHVADTMEAERDRLTELDAALGDGDLGVTMALGCRAVRDAIGGLGESDIGTILCKAGSAFGGDAPSTMGVLIATALMRAGKAGQGLRELGTPDLARLAAAAQEGIQHRGKAQVGDKTVLDALAPAVAALQAAAAEGATLTVALTRAAAGARTGADSTRQMKSRTGRAGWLQERSVGHLDPGAVSCSMVLEFLAREITTWEAGLHRG